MPVHFPAEEATRASIPFLSAITEHPFSIILLWIFQIFTYKIALPTNLHIFYQNSYLLPSYLPSFIISKNKCTFYYLVSWPRRFLFEHVPSLLFVESQTLWNRSTSACFDSKKHTICRSASRCGSVVLVCSFIPFTLPPLPHFSSFQIHSNSFASTYHHYSHSLMSTLLFL